MLPLTVADSGTGPTTEEGGGTKGPSTLRIRWAIQAAPRVRGRLSSFVMDANTWFAAAGVKNSRG